MKKGKALFLFWVLFFAGVIAASSGRNDDVLIRVESSGVRMNGELVSQPDSAGQEGEMKKKLIARLDSLTDGWDSLSSARVYVDPAAGVTFNALITPLLACVYARIERISFLHRTKTGVDTLLLTNEGYFGQIVGYRTRVGLFFELTLHREGIQLEMGSRSRFETQDYAVKAPTVFLNRNGVQQDWQTLVAALSTIHEQLAAVGYDWPVDFLINLPYSDDAKSEDLLETVKCVRRSNPDEERVFIAIGTYFAKKFEVSQIAPTKEAVLSLIDWNHIAILAASADRGDIFEKAVAAGAEPNAKYSITGFGFPEE